MIVGEVMTAPVSFSKMLVELPGLSKHEQRRAPNSTNSPSRKTAGQPAKRTVSALPERYAMLLDLRAATLDQNDQHDYNERSAYDLNDGGTIHVQFSFLQ
jgi:hypothetical protein